MNFSSVIFEGDAQKRVGNGLDNQLKMPRLFSKKKSMQFNIFAKLAIDYNEEHVWMDDGPREICNLVVQEILCKD